MQTEKDLEEMFQKIMAHCKCERKTKTNISNKQLAAKMNITENYLSAIESARAIPSLPTFLRYLVFCGFDISFLIAMVIKDEKVLRPVSPLKNEVIQRVYNFNDEQVAFIYEQLKLAEMFTLRVNHTQKKNS